MEIYNLNAGVSLKSLFSELDETKLQQVVEASKNGFTENELQQLEKDGIDISKIVGNACPDLPVMDEGVELKTSSDVDKKAQELKEKYCKDLTVTGDIYSISNPQLVALNTALDDGVLEELSISGFDKTQIIEIISLAFNVGISNSGNGKYSCPYGHGEEASAIYNKFSSELLKVSGEDAKELMMAKNDLIKLNNEIIDNNRQLKNLEYEITSLQSKIEEKLEKAIDESEEIVEEQKEDAKNIVNKRLNEYTNANGDISYEDFQKNLESDLDTLAGTSNSKLSQVTSTMVNAQREMSTLNGYLGTMKSLVDKSNTLTTQAQDKQAEVKELTQKVEENSTKGDEDCNKCDPIGFTQNGVRYDFFVDKDNDGNITNENEFLGAENGFSEMMKLDSDGNREVSASELDKMNVKIIVTNADGSQVVKKASEVLGENDSVNLSSYRSTNQTLKNGNQLLGKFSMNIDGKEINTGYQTFDSIGWLDENYEFSDEIAGKGRFESGEIEVAQADDYSDRYNIFMSKYHEMSETSDKILSKLNIDSKEVKEGISKASISEAQKDGAQIEAEFDKQAQKAQEKEQAEKEAQEEELKKEELEEEKD